MKKAVIGILAHVDAGKTTLTEALLYESGTINKVGRVDNKDAFLDTYAIEKERGITVFSKQAEMDFEDLHMTLIDTPGHVDFGAEMERSLMILDYAILVVSAADGIQGHTLTLWSLLGKYNIPTFIFVNKMDRPDTDCEKIMSELHKELSDRIMDFSQNEIPYEEVSLCDDSLLDEYLSNGCLSEKSMADAVECRKLFPCFFGSALKLTGIKELISGMTALINSGKYSDTLSGRIYKISRDDKGERLTFMKLTGGRLKARDAVSGLHENGEVWGGKVNSIRIYSGSRFDTVSEVTAGTVCAVTGLADTGAGDVFGDEKNDFKPHLEPVISYGIILPEAINISEAYGELSKISEEIPELAVTMNRETGDITVKVMGQVQTEIFSQLVKERTGLDIRLGAGHIVYKETIDDEVLGIGHFEPLKHYAEVCLKLEPAERGTGMIFDNCCNDDLLAVNWQRLIMTHLEERRHKGVLIGADITDIKITLIIGKAHLKHTEGGDFRQAVYRAVRQGLMKARCRLLEPVYSFRIELPVTCVGRAMNDIQQMSGSFGQPENHGDTAILCGRAPVSGMMAYGSELMSYTHGMGKITMIPDGYDYCHNEEEVIATACYEPEADIENTADSVFCAHGAGFVVPWNSVEQYMHLDITQHDNCSEEINMNQWDFPPSGAADVKTKLDLAMGTEEVDEIIARSGGANKATKSASHRGLYGKRHKAVYPVVRNYKAPQKKVKYMLVDGYNVIFAWKELAKLAKDNIDSARGRLIDIMCDYQAAKQVELIVVFDAYRIQGHRTEVVDINNIHVVYTKEAQTADRYIEEFAHNNGERYDITVVTSDGLEQIIIRGEGCALISSREFENEVENTCRSHVENYRFSKLADDKSYIGELLESHKEDNKC